MKERYFYFMGHFLLMNLRTRYFVNKSKVNPFIDLGTPNSKRVCDLSVTHTTQRNIIITIPLKKTKNPKFSAEKEGKKYDEFRKKNGSFHKEMSIRGFFVLNELKTKYNVIVGDVCFVDYIGKKKQIMNKGLYWFPNKKEIKITIPLRR